MRSALDIASLDDWDDEPAATTVDDETPVELDPVHEGAIVKPSVGPELDERDLEARRARSKRWCSRSTEPVEPTVLAQLVELPVARVEALCDELWRSSTRSRGRGFVLARVAGGYRFQTHPDLAPYVERFVLDGQHARLSAPALETLAIVAYKQPISRGQISAIRGVNVEATLTTLLQRGYVQEVGRDPGPGTAVLYGTTRCSSSGSACVARRPAAARRLRPRRVGGRGARARAAPRATTPRPTTHRCRRRATRPPLD